MFWGAQFFRGKRTRRCRGGEQQQQQHERSKINIILNIICISTFVMSGPSYNTAWGRNATEKKPTVVSPLVTSMQLRTKSKAVPPVSTKMPSWMNTIAELSCGARDDVQAEVDAQNGGCFYYYDDDDDIKKSPWHIEFRPNNSYALWGVEWVMCDAGYGKVTKCAKVRRVGVGRKSHDEGDKTHHVEMIYKPQAQD